MSRPRIGLDVRITRQMSAGMRAYSQELSRRLPRVAPDLEFVSFSHGANFGWDEQVLLPARLRRARLNLTHFLSVYTPALPPRPYVLTIHDLIHLRFPAYFKAKVSPYYRTVVRLACRRAACVVTDDDRTRADLERYLGVPSERVRVIPLGIDDRFLGPIQPFVASRPYLLYVGNHRAHKDLPTLFSAWQSLPAEIDIDLYLTGPSDLGGAEQTYRRRSGEIAFLGNISTGELARLYAGARALVHPALAEGFGLPLLEAMGSGCPVVACEGAVPAVLRGAVLTFPPRNAVAASGAVARLLRDETLRGRLVDEGRSRAETLTWDRCAESTAGLYREILEQVAYSRAEGSAHAS